MKNLLTELQNIRKNHKESYLDALWICVKKPSDMTWREAKKIGMKKDSYYGWIFYSTSTNSNGYELLEKIKIACTPYNMRVSTYEL